ncbi:energy transducer TonB [Anabaena sp. PCC 7108]|uniref:energy transducer TonB n=1 Tax=Anabaena sp. PCC 7108 TaxID=163908 RepID=UPI00034A4183|nr:energy transducer TonB [Anabaena sp. PCC 7108]
MGFSSIAIEQREKETEALKTVLLYSLIGSLALHLGVLALCISKFLLKVPNVKDQPIEVTILETIPDEIAKPQANKNSPVNINSGGGGGGGNGVKNLIPAATSISGITPAFLPVAKQHQPKTTNNFIAKQPQAPTIPEPATTQPPVETKPIQRLDENSNTPASNQPQLDATVTNDSKTQNIQSSKLEIQPSSSYKNISTTSTSSTQPSQNVVSTSGNLFGNLGNRLRNSLGNGSGNGVGNGSGNGVGNGSGNGVGNGSGNGVGNGSGNGIGNGSGNGIGNGVGNKPKTEDTTVATAPKPPIENSSKLNRADCLQCQIKYPNRARQRGIEGNPEVAIDTDKKGNVTRVRLIRSSGDSELDQAAQQAAQEWKLTPTEAGRQGVRASVNFAIKGSQRHRQLQERQIEKQREAAQKKPEKEASTSTFRESPQHNQRKITPIITDISPENTTRRRQESPPSESKPVSSPRQRVEPEKPKQIEESTPRRRSPQSVKSDTNNQADEGKAERVQKSQRRLEEILRRRQKSSDSPAPAEAPTPPKPATTSPTESNSDSEISN